MFSLISVVWLSSYLHWQDVAPISLLFPVIYLSLKPFITPPPQRVNNKLASKHLKKTELDF